ncbi:ead/Ea22-like family protein [Salmonella enterica]|nr:ead/Ea22-like family protein [Salmonella enterica]
MTALNKQALREAAEKATPGRVGDRIDGSGSIKYQCFGYDGSLVLQADHKNMEYGFIGDNGGADELFFRLCVPDVVLELLDELDAAEKRIAELETRTITVKFEPIPMEELGNRRDGKKHPYMFGAGYNSAVVHCESVLHQACAAAGIGVKGE